MKVIQAIPESDETRSPTKVLLALENMKAREAALRAQLDELERQEATLWDIVNWYFAQRGI